MCCATRAYADAEPPSVQGDPYNRSESSCRDLKLLDNPETGKAVMTLDYQQDTVPRPPWSAFTPMWTWPDPLLRHRPAHPPSDRRRSRLENGER